MVTWLEWWTIVAIKQGLAPLVPGWVTHGSCSGGDVGLARFTTLVAACLMSSREATGPAFERGAL